MVAWGFKPINFYKLGPAWGMDATLQPLNVNWESWTRPPVGTIFLCGKTRNHGQATEQIKKQPMEFVVASVFDGKPFLLHNIWNLGGFISSGYTLFSTRVYGSL